MSYLAPPKTFEINLHWFQTVSDRELPLELAAEFDNLNNSCEYIVLGTIKSLKRFTAKVYNPKVDAPVQYYDAFNVAVGDWIAINTTGFAWRIAKIYTVLDIRYTQTDSLHFYAKMIDYNKFNASIDRLGRGFGSPAIIDSKGVLFTVDNAGSPILSGLDSFAIAANFADVIQSRFTAFNVKMNYISIFQEGVALILQVGDVIFINRDTNKYEKSFGNSFTIGIVTSTGIPSNDYFTFRPFGRYINADEINLKGNTGTIYYADPSGENQLIRVKPDSNVFPVYQIIDEEKNAILLNNPFDPQFLISTSISSIFSTVFTILFSTMLNSTFFGSSLFTSTFSTIHVSSAYIENLYASDAFINKLVASDIVVNNLLTNYIGSPNDIVYFTSPLQADIATISTIHSDGIYLRGASSFNKGLLYADSSLNLYWNGSSIFDYIGRNFGGSTFSSLYALKVYTNELYANDAYVQRLWASDANFDVATINYASISTATVNYIEAQKASISIATVSIATVGIANINKLSATTADIRSLNATDGSITNLKTTTIGLPADVGSDIDKIKFLSPIEGQSAEFENVYANDAVIDNITASDVNVNYLLANYIGGAEENLYFTTPFQAINGKISTLDTDGIYITGTSSFNKGLLYTDSSLTLYWNGVPISGPLTSSISTFSAVSFRESYAEKGYLDSLYTQNTSILSVDTTLIKTNVIETNYIGLPLASIESEEAVEAVEAVAGTKATKATKATTLEDREILFTSPFLAPVGNIVNLTAENGSINKLSANEAFISEIIASDSKINNLEVNYVGTSNETIYFTSKFEAPEGEISKINTNSICLGDTLSKNKGELYADASMTLYWNGVPISGPASAPAPQINNDELNATATQIIAQEIFANSAEINKIGTNFIGLSELNEEQAGIIFTSPIIGPKADLSHLTASDAKINNIVTNYIGADDRLFFTSPFSAPEANLEKVIATSAFIQTHVASDILTGNLKANKINVTHLDSKNLETEGIKIKTTGIGEGLLHTDTSLNLCWNGNPLEFNPRNLTYLDNLSVDNFHTADSFNNRLVASDTIINNITANYIGSTDDILYITSPYRGSQAFVEKITASDADITWLRIERLGSLHPKQPMEFISKFEATAAKIISLEVSSLVYTGTTIQQMAFATGSSQKPGNSLKYSLDGITWVGTKIATEDADLQITAMKYNGLFFLAAGTSDYTTKLFQSDDGITWVKRQTLSMYQHIDKIHWFKAHWILAGKPTEGTASTILVSKDALKWVAPQGISEKSTIYSNLVDNGTMLLALGSNTVQPYAIIIHSTDLLSWHNSDTLTFPTVAKSADWDGSTWIAVGDISTCMLRSNNGSTWLNSQSSKSVEDTKGIKVANDIRWQPTDKYWLASGNTIVRSTDGYDWVSSEPPSIATNQLLWMNPLWLGLADVNRHAIIINSGNGVSWVHQSREFSSSEKRGTLEMAVTTGTHTKTTVKSGVTTVTFDLSDPFQQSYEITPADSVVMCHFLKSQETVATEKTIQIILYAAYFTEGHTIKIQTAPYELEDMPLEVYKNIKFTIKAPNNELTIDPLNPHIESTLLGTEDRLELLLYKSNWIAQ